jgi:hypothetical protein
MPTIQVWLENGEYKSKVVKDGKRAFTTVYELPQKSAVNQDLACPFCGSYERSVEVYSRTVHCNDCEASWGDGRAPLEPPMVHSFPAESGGSFFVTPSNGRLHIRVEADASEPDIEPDVSITPMHRNVLIVEIKK